MATTVADKDRKPFARDLKTIYNAPNEEQGRINRDRVSEKWSEKYPNAMRRWERDWDVITPIFKFSADVRTVIYTTNAIESLNSTYRKLNRQRSVFPSGQALLKAPVPGNLRSNEKMEHADPELGPGLWRTGDHVRRSSSGIKKAASNGRSDPPAVDMLLSISYKISNCQTAIKP